MKRDRDSLDQDQEPANHSCKRTTGQPELNSGQLKFFLSDPKTIDILIAKGIKSLFPIQQQTFFDIYNGLDVLARDRTGSGKTLAFSLPIIQKFRKKKLFDGRGTTKMMVVLPTRQLAVQVATEISSLKHSQKEYDVALAYGGTSVMEQRYAIEAGSDIIVGTPGRLVDFLQKEFIDTQKLSVLVLDEADQMLKMGFKEEVDKILKFIKAKTSNSVQTLLFSATLPGWIMGLSKNYLAKDHKVVSMIPSQQNSCPKTIKHYKVQFSGGKKADCIKDLLQHFVEKAGRCIIFCETKRQTNLLQLQLSKMLNEPIQALNGDIPQEKRLRTFTAVNKGNLRFIVATNVAARGLDIPNIELVIQCSPPRNTEDYIHRSGRTGRAGKEGICATVYTREEEYVIERIQHDAKILIQLLVVEAKVPSSNQSSQNRYTEKSRYSGADYSQPENRKTMESNSTQFMPQCYGKTNNTPVQLSEYVKGAFDGYEAKVTVPTNTGYNKGKGTKTYFEDASEVMKTDRRFKSDGSRVQMVQADAQNKMERDY